MDFLSILHIFFLLLVIVHEGMPLDLLFCFSLDPVWSCPSWSLKVDLFKVHWPSEHYSCRLLPPSIQFRCWLNVEPSIVYSSDLFYVQIFGSQTHFQSVQRVFLNSSIQTYLSKRKVLKNLPISSVCWMCHRSRADFVKAGLSLRFPLDWKVQIQSSHMPN